MNKNEYLNKYMPLIGKKVVDNLFNTKRLTKTAILNKYVELFAVPKAIAVYETEDNAGTIAVLSEVVEVCHQLDITEANEWSNFNIMPHSIGNSKIGKDTLVISFNSALLCYMNLLGRCSNCKICYAVNSNKMYSNEFLKGCIGQIAFLKHSGNSTELHQLIFNTVWSIICSYSANQIDNLKYLRINVTGDILDNNQLKSIDYITGAIVKSFDLINAYGYTHNKELDLSIAKNIVFNCSDFEYKGNKSCKTIYEFDAFNYDEGSTILCNGNCFNCPYCKSEFECREVLFLAHGGQFEGIEGINNYIVAYLEYNKQNDYLLFMRQKAEV